MQAIVRDLYIKLGTACFYTLQAQDERTSKKLYREIAGLLNRTFTLWGIKECRSYDTEVQEEMRQFWYKALQACVPEAAEFFAACPEGFWISNAVRIHAVFLAVAQDPTLALHTEEALFYAEELDKLCDELITEEKRAREARNTVHKLPQRSLTAAPRARLAGAEVVSISSFLERRRRKR